MNVNDKIHLAPAPVARATWALAALLAAPVAATAASVNLAELERLTTTAKARGDVAVMIHMADIGLGDIKARGEAVRAEMKRRADTLLAELGPDAINGGVWNNGVGQLGVHLTAQGLRKLQASGNVLSFSADATRGMRLRVSNRTGALSAIEQALSRSRTVEVEAVLDLEGVSYELDRQGRTIASWSASFEAETMDRAQAILSAHPSLARLNTPAAVRTHLLATHGALVRNLKKDGAVTVELTVDRAAYYGLREQEGVLALRPVGFRDSRPMFIDPQALAAAKAHGTAEVEIVLRGSEAFTEFGGGVSKANWRAQKKTHEAALEDIVAAAGPGASMTANHGEVGGAFARLPLAALEALQRKGDARIASVSLLKGAAAPALNNSTRVLMNMPPAWNAGYRGAGQYIALLDTGVRKRHLMMANSSGQTRVVAEACFGSNETIAWGPLAGTYSSMCPSANASTGDSPPGLLDSGDVPILCGTSCSHGTAIAGIAAGRAMSSEPNFQGVAPDASIVSVNVFSKQISGGPYPFGVVALPKDIADGLGYLYSLTGPTGVMPATVNLSLASRETYTGNCDGVNSTVTAHVQNLLSRGVPVVAATGNNGSRSSIAWPACVSSVFQVTPSFEPWNCQSFGSRPTLSKAELMTV